MRHWQRGIAGAIALVILMTGPLLLSAAALEPMTPAFERTWARTDQPVQDQTISRTWMWGDGGFTATMLEPYEEADIGWRVVQYYDKSRMEDATFRGAEPPWDVSNGLLVNELITGRMQLGDNVFEEHEPANVGVAGDPDDTSGVTYAFMGNLLDESATPEGTVIDRLLTPAGSTLYTSSDAMAAHGITAGAFVDATNHTVATPFWEFMNSSGPVYENGQIATAPLFENPFYATGLPITEAYWATVKVGNTPRDVLLQCFERRCLTYTPANSPEWRVEMGNVGQHYYIWRYGTEIPDAPPALDGNHDSLPPAPLVLWPIPIDGDTLLLLLNDSPYPLQITFDGPVNETLTIDANPDGVVHPDPNVVVDCDPIAPAGEIYLPPGNYRVSFDFLAGDVQPASSHWTLVPDGAYSTCYHVFETAMNGTPEQSTPETTGAVQIETILYDSPVPDEVSGEYVVLRNVDDHAIQMQGWRIVDAQGNTLTFPNFVLQPGTTVTYHNCTGTNDASNLYSGACEAMWNNGGDIATLYDTSGSVVDTYSY